MIEIEKLKEGRRISRDEYQKAKAAYELAYVNADENTRAKLDGLMQSSLNYSSADPMNNRSTREFATLMYLNGVKIANGEYDQPLAATASTKNIFNGYSNSENINNANTLTSKYLNNKPKKETTSSEGTSGKSFYKFNWADGIGNSFGLDTDTFQDKYSRFVDGLITNVDNALRAQSEGKTIRGLSQDAVSQLGIISDGLKSLKAKSGELDQNTALKELLKFANPLNIDEQGFKTYFNGFLPQLTQADKNKQTRISEGYQFGTESSGNAALDAAMKLNGWVIGQLNGKNYMFDSQFNLLNTPSFGVDDDYLSQGYNTAYGIGQDGLIWTGNTSDIADQNHPYYQQYQNFLTQAKEKYNALYGVSDSPWDKLNSQSDNQLLNAISNEIHGKKWIDVGRYFNGDTPVIAVPNDGGTINTDAYGNLKFDNLKLYYLGSDGSAKTGNREQVSQELGGFNRQGYDQSEFISAENYNLDGMASNINYNQNYSGRNWWGNFLAGLVGLDINGDLTWDLGNKDRRNASFSGNISDHPDDWAKLVLDSIANDTNKTFLGRFKYFSDPTSLAVIINRIIKETGMELTPELREAYQSLLRRAGNQQSGLQQTQEVLSEKEGGILKMAQGNSVTVLGNNQSTASKVRQKYSAKEQEADALGQRASQNGVKDNVQAAGEKGWTSSDSLRAAALIQDIAGTVAALSGAFTEGAGSVAGEVLGFTSMGTDLIADITDESVSGWDVAKNAAINTGFALTSFIPGAKTSKMVKSAIKILPHAMTALAAANIALDPEIHKSIGKVMNGGANNENITTKDWQNIMIALRAVNGIGRSTAAVKNQRTTSKRLEKVQSSVNPDEVSVQLGKDKVARMTKSEANKIDAALKTGASDEIKQEATAILSKHGETLDSINTNKNPQTWKERLTRGGEKSLERVTAQTDIDPIKLQAELAKEDSAFQSKLQNSAWQREMSRWDQRLSRLAPGVNKRTSYSPFQMAMIRQYGIKPGMSGSTSELQDQLVANSPYGVFIESLGTERNYEQAREATKANNKRSIISDLETDTDSKGRKYSDSAAARRQARKDVTEATTKYEEANKLYNDNETALNDEIAAQKTREATLDGIRNDAVKQAQISAAESEYAAKEAAYKAEITKSEVDSVASKLLDAEVKAANLKVQQAKQELLAAEKAVNDGSTSIADLLAKQTQYKNALDIAKTKMDNANQILSEEETSFRSLRDSIKAKSQGRKDKDLKKAVNSANASKSKTFKDLEVIDDSGKKTTIKKGTNIVSLVGLSDAEANRVIPSNAKKISKTEAQKLVPEGTKVNGAAISGGKLYIFETGGQIYNKYSHLRK